MEETPELRKIRAILAKAENEAATPEESEAYTAMAAKLMAKYGIDAARLAESAPGSDPIENERVFCAAPYAMEKVHLLHNIATALGCQTVVLNERGEDNEKILHIFGHRSDLNRTEMLYTSLLLQQANGLRHVTPRWGEDIRAYRRSWLTGFASAILKRLNETERVAKSEAAPSAQSGRSMELVVADRSAAVDKTFKSHYPRLKTTRRTLSGSGGREGYSAGERANLASGSVGSWRQALGR